MAFFGLFKSKDEQQLHAKARHLQDMLFPGGEKTVARDCTRVAALINHKMSAENLSAFVAGCKAMHFLTAVEDENVLVASHVNRAEGKITRKEAYDIFVYFAGECCHYDALWKQMNSTGAMDPSLFEKVCGDLNMIYAQGVFADEIPSGFGEYGLVATNPIPSISVRSSNEYIGKLRTKVDHSAFIAAGIHFQPKLPTTVEATRVGSTSTEVTPGAVDIYKLSFEGRDKGTIFICPYHKANSKRAPKGFELTAE